MTTPPPEEIELKLALPPQQAPAFLKRMARRRSQPERQTLVTRYFDTPDFALSGDGVALRVRRVVKGAGQRPRWLQTLKTEGERQGGLSRRVEYEMPVSRGEPDWGRFPPEARALVPEPLRVRVVPVFETRFERTAWLLKGAGGARIEVALDVGEVASQSSAGERSAPICEIELELKSGRPDALFALALEWAVAFDGLPFDVSKAERGVRLARGIAAEPVKSAPVALDDGMGVEEAFAAIVQACLAQFQTNLPGVLASEDIEYVHQARVALRRLRAALRLFRKACPVPPELLDGLRALAVALGPARDWDVLCSETLPPIAPHVPAADAWLHGMRALEAHRADVRAAMREALGRARPGVWLLAMHRWLLRHGWRFLPDGETVPAAQRFTQLAPLDAWARRALKKGHRRIVRGGRDFAALAPARRHALRIAIKRQRYAVEFFETLFEDGHAQRPAHYLAALRDAQESLGRLNDARVASDLLTAAQVESGPMGAFVLGWLAAQRANMDGAEGAGPVRALLGSKPYW
ncbi:MAG: CHAD domain-containing protein [Betaproteobacteria bacterium]|nr:CHAD domain-containing protein [Betaproteobacteria bacterium]